MKISTFLIAFFATIVQCYDYALFGLSAGALSKTFMPDNSSTEQILNFFAIFSIAVIARPIGSIIFGIIGDNYGRVAALKLSILLSAISTGLIGIMPGFSTIGYAATILLAMLRMVFLMSIAGEIDSVRIYVLEKSGRFKNLGSGIISTCSQAGALLASLSYHYAINSEIDYLWRINFMIGTLCGCVLLMLRRYFVESSDFINYHSKNSVGKKALDFSIMQPVLQNKVQFFSTLLISGCSGGVYHFLIIFFSTFLTDIVQLMQKPDAQLLNMFFIGTYSCMALVSGFLADKFSPHKQIICALILSIIIATTLQFTTVTQDARDIICTAAAILIGSMPFYTIPLQIITPSMFTIDIRMRLYSLSRSLGSIMFSATTPFFCMLIWKYTKSVQLIFTFLTILLIAILTSIIFLLRYQSKQQGLSELMTES